MDVSDTRPHSRVQSGVNRIGIDKKQKSTAQQVDADRMLAVDRKPAMLPRKRQADDLSISRVNALEGIKCAKRMAPQRLQHELHRWIADLSLIILRHNETTNTLSPLNDHFRTEMVHMRM